MREIKFRYVYSDDKDFFYSILPLEELELGSFSSVLCGSFSSEVYRCIAKSQCTGLKDKNGAEIYEGDIIKKTGDIKAYSVVFDDALAAYLMDDGTGGYGLNQTLLRDFEIIGDIHKNPELLKGKKK